MKRLRSLNHVAAWFAGIFLFAIPALAQQRSAKGDAAQRYDSSREVSLQGTVVSFTANSSKPPLGPHAVVQTSSGQVDVHLGDLRTLQAAHLALAAGDSVRVIGENVVYGDGTQFFARVIQKGGQAVVLRSARGFPLRPVGKAGKSEAGAL